MAEKQFIIPLRKEFRKAPVYKRTKKAVNALRSYIQRHMKVQEVKIGSHLNQKLWERGCRNPPPKVKVHSKVEKLKDKEFALVELDGFEFEKIVEKKEEKPKKEEHTHEGETKEQIQKEEAKKVLEEGKVASAPSAGVAHTKQPKIVTVKTAPIGATGKKSKGGKSA